MDEDLNNQRSWFFDIDHRWKEKSFSIGFNIGYRRWVGGEYSINLFLLFWAISIGFNNNKFPESKETAWFDE